MGCTYHCWIIPATPGANPRDHEGHPCCFCGGVPHDEKEMITFSVEYTKSRQEIRGLAKDDCALCGGEGMLGEHRPTVCECVRPGDGLCIRSPFI